MSSATIVRCADCGSAAPDSIAGWLTCPTCHTVYCSTCPSEHRVVAHGECDSTQACTVCGGTCLIDL